MRCWLRIIVLLLSCLLGCRSASTVPSAGADAVAARPSDEQEVPAVAAPGDEAWLAALRVMDYRAAARAFDHLHPAPASESLRFVRATIAFELGDHARVVALCPGLAQALPHVATRIERQCLQSEVASAPSVESARRLAALPDLDDALRGVDALIELSAYGAARSALDDRMQREKAKSAGLERLRRTSAELWERTGELERAARDFEWLALQAPTHASAAGADVEYERLSGRRLSKAERYARAESFTRSGHRERALAELDAIATAPGPKLPRADLLRTRAWAHYRSRHDYAAASELFSQSAKLDPTHRTQDQFYAARSLSRAHRDEEAIALYEKLVRERPDGVYTEEARYLVGRLRFILGQWDAAIAAHTAYLARYRARGRFGSSARHDLAVAYLARGRGELAAPVLEALLEDTASARSSAALRELLGLAFMQQGRIARATSEFQRVITERPLSFAAMMAALRLEQLGVPPPPAIPRSEPEPEAPPLDVRLPEAVRWSASLGLHLDAERELARRAREVERRYAPRGGEALCLSYGQLTVARERYRHAQRAIRERALLRSITGATRWLWDCMYPRPYSDAVAHAEQAHRLPSGLVHAVMRQESAFAPSVGSSAGAAGLMQLMPATAASAAADLGLGSEALDLHVPAHNIRLGSYYLSRLLSKFDGQVPLAVAAYNAGPFAVSRWLEAGHQLPLDVFVAYIPYKETRGYVQRVVGNWARYRYLAAGARAVPALTLGLPAPVELTRSDY